MLKLPQHRSSLWNLNNAFYGPLARYVQLLVRMRRECRERFLRHCGKRPRHASRHVRHARAVMRVGIAYPWFPLKSAAGENVPGIPGASAIHNFTFLVRCPLSWGVKLRYDLIIKKLWMEKMMIIFLEYIPGVGGPGAPYYHGLILITTWISYHMCSKMGKKLLIHAGIFL